MSNPEHDLAVEFPQFKETIHTLKTTDNHFKRLFGEYEDVCGELHRGLEGAGVISEDRAEDLKRKRLALKDQLYSMLTAAAPAKKTGSCCGSC